MKSKMNFFATLLRDFILFVLFVLFFNFVVFVIISFSLYKETFDISEVIRGNDKGYFYEEKYEEYNIEEKIGKDSYFTVLEEDGKVIYSSIKGDYKGLSGKFFQELPKDDGILIFDKNSYKTEEGEQFYQLIFDVDSENYEEETYTMIFNSDYEVLFSSIKDLQIDISSSEFEFFFGELRGEYYLDNYHMKTKSGKNISIVFYKRAFQSKRVDKLMKMWKWAFIAIFIVGVFGYLIQLDIRVKIPLKLLDASIQEFTDGNREKPIEYKGPKEFVQICQNFNKMAEQLSKSERDKQRIISDLSHDLKTPMTVIQSYSKALIDDIVPQEEKENYIRIIYNKCDSLKEMINHVSEYNKLQRADFQMNLESVDFGEFIREIFIDKYDELSYLGYNMDIDIPEWKIPVKIDTFHMRRVLENIISNTMKYNKKGTRISCSIHVEDDKAHMIIGDDGVGIPEEVRENIFKPFIIGDKSRTNGESSGLGMSIIQKIIEAHGGTVKFVDTEDTELSTAFEIILNIERK